MDAPSAAIIGGALCVVSLSWNRMGPAYTRRRLAPVALISGIAVLTLWNFNNTLADDFLCGVIDSCGESELPIVLRHAVAWILLLVIGGSLVLHGSGSYGAYALPSLVLGWIIVLASLAFSLAFNPSGSISMAELVTPLPVILGMISGLVAILGMVVLSESLEPPLPPAPALDDEEKRVVRTILERHLGGRGE